MADRDDRRHSISEVSAMTDVPVHVLRQWEDRFKQLKPGRNRAGRRYYYMPDIALVRQIKELLWHEKLTTEGARKRLDQQLRGEGRPSSRQDVVDLIDKIEEEVRTMLDILDSG